MKTRWDRLSLVGVSFALAVVLLASSAASAQDMDRVSPAIAGTLLFFFLGMAFVAYLYMALSLQTIATKTGAANAWLAWIPIANIFLMLEIAKKPGWWFILFLVPLANVVVSILVWMEIAKARKKPDWWGILIIVPLVNLVVPGYLAWAD
jgi:hypothetical protein